MSLFAIADTHLSLSSDKPMDKFGRRWQGYIQKLERNWRAVVTDADTVVIAGDISWAMRLPDAAADFAFLHSLPGKKLLLKGNHDYYFETVTKTRDFLQSRGLDSFGFIHNNSVNVEGFIISGTRGWYVDEDTQKENADFEKTVSREAIRLDLSLCDGERFTSGERVVFTHFPVVFGDYVCRPLLDVLHSHGVGRVYYGHIHGSYTAPRVITCEKIEFTLISADFLDFTPLKITHRDAETFYSNPKK